MAVVKKFGVQDLNDIEECNMFKDDNTVTHIRKPKVQFSVRENLLVLTGNPETKNLQDCVGDVIKQVGPQQYEALKNMMGDITKNMTGKPAEDDEDDVPPLVGTFEDASKK